MTKQDGISNTQKAFDTHWRMTNGQKLPQKKTYIYEVEGFRHRNENFVVDSRRNTLFFHPFCDRKIILLLNIWLPKNHRRQQPFGKLNFFGPRQHLVIPAIAALFSEALNEWAVLPVS